MIEHDLFAAIGVCRVTGNRTKHVKTVGKLDYAAGLNSLPGILIARSDQLISGKRSAGLLSPGVHVLVVPVFAFLEMPHFTALLIIHTRIAEPLCEVDVMDIQPLGIRTSCLLKKPIRQFQQPDFFRFVVEPVDMTQHFSGSVVLDISKPSFIYHSFLQFNFLPLCTGGNKGLRRYSATKSKEAQQCVDYPFIGRTFVVPDQRIDHHHMREKIDKIAVIIQNNLFQLFGTEIAVRILTAQNRINPVVFFPVQLHVAG